MKWLAKNGGKALVFVILAWVVAVHVNALLAGQPLPALQWAQGKAQVWGPKAAPAVDRATNVAEGAVTKAGEAAGNADPGSFRMTDGWRVLLIVAGVLLLVWVVQRAARPEAKGKGKGK